MIFGLGLGFLGNIRSNIKYLSHGRLSLSSGVVLTSQSQATLRVLFRLQICMLDFSVPSDSISLFGFDLGFYVALEDNVKHLSHRSLSLSRAGDNNQIPGDPGRLVPA